MAMMAQRSMADIFEMLRREEALVAPGELDPLGPFKSRLYFNDWKSTVRFLVYTLLFRTEFRFAPKTGARWILSRPDGSVGAVAESYLNGFREIVGERYKFSELLSRDRYAFWRVFARLGRLAVFLAKRQDLALRERVLFGAARARFVDDEDALQRAIGQTESLGVITFCDQIGAENHIAQFVLRNSKMAITLQHGQYRLLAREQISPDIEAMYNFVSHKMLCWGEATIREFEKIGVARNRFVPVGVLRQDMKAERKRPSAHRDGMRRNAFGLALCGDNNRHNNAELIAFAKKMQAESGMACVLRMHPRSNLALYPALTELAYTQEPSKEGFFNSIDVAVMSSTGFFLDCFYRRCPFVFLNSRFLPEPFRFTRVVVSSPGELCAVLDEYDWVRLEKEVPYYYDDAEEIGQRIREVLDGSV